MWYAPHLQQQHARSLLSGWFSWSFRCQSIIKVCSQGFFNITTGNVVGRLVVVVIFYLPFCGCRVSIFSINNFLYKK